MTRALLVAGALALCAACGGPGPATFGPRRVQIPVPPDEARAPASGGASAREPPPRAGAAKESPFPAVARARLASGLGVAVVTSRALPIVQIRVLVRAGAGFGAAPGVAELTASMLKDGGTRALTSAEVLRRIETLGADLSVRTDLDATVLGTAVTRDQLGEALGLLSQVVREPRFDARELDKLKTRARDQAEDAARSSGSWTATRVVFRELFPQRSAYATSGLVPSEIAAIDGAAIRDFHRRFYVPKATEVVLAGDVDEATGRALVDQHFGKWTGGEPPRIAIERPREPARKVVVAHRPRSVQSDVFIATLAPERRAATWPHVRVANQVLGGGVASRLFADVRERRSLAYRTNAQILELAHGEQPLVLYAGTQTPKTAEAVAGLLDNLEKMTSSPPTSAETEAARRYLSDVFAIRMETIGAIADMVVTQDALGLPDGYWDAYRRALRGTTAAEVAEAARALYARARAGGGLVVVAGDADAIADDLARFGDVTVVDPEREFKITKTVPRTPSGEPR